MRPSYRGITLIEILVVVAITAILASIALILALQAQKRAKVAWTKSEMRALSESVKIYYIENSIQPAWGIGHPGPGGVRTFNHDVARRTGNNSGVGDLPSFLLCDRSTSAGCFNTLTTAIGFISTKGGQTFQIGPPGEHFAYIDSYPVDPFCADRGATFVYWSIFPGVKEMKLLGDETQYGGVGWIVVSPGPDGDYDLPGSYYVYNPMVSQSSPLLLYGANARGSAFTYDPTNGLISGGDIWRVMQ